MKHWSLRTLRERLIKIGAQVVSRSKEVTLQIGDVVVPRRLFAPILDRIGVCGSSRGRVERAGKVRRVDAVGILTATVRLEGPNPGEGRGQVPPQQGSFANPGRDLGRNPLERRHRLASNASRDQPEGAVHRVGRLSSGNSQPTEQLADLRPGENPLDSI